MPVLLCNDVWAVLMVWLIMSYCCIKLETRIFFAFVFIDECVLIYSDDRSIMFLQKGGNYLPHYMLLSVTNIYCTVNIRFQKSTSLLTNNVFLFAAPPQERSIHFTDPKAIVYIYGQQMGYIKTMKAFCIPECKITYNIVNGKSFQQSIFLQLSECCIMQSKLLT
jgi:hypothetical protein